MESNQAPTISPPLDRERDYPMTGLHNQNPPGQGFWSLVREDRTTHESILTQGFLAVFANRLGNWRMGIRSSLLRFPFTSLYRYVYHCSHWSTRIELPYIVKIGRRVRIWHHGGCVLGACSIGNDVQIRHNVTIGLANHGDPVHNLPIIEDRVILGAGCAILGPITIGHDSVVGANSVVSTDIPPYSLVVGMPGRVIKTLDGTQETHVEVEKSSTQNAGSRPAS